MFLNNNDFITIKLTKNETQIKSNPLFKQIPIRQVNKSLYNGKLVNSDTLTQLMNIATENSIKVHSFKNEFDTIKKFVMLGNNFQMNNDAFKNELLSWIRVNKRHHNSTNDGLSYSTLEVPSLPLFIYKALLLTDNC